MFDLFLFYFFPFCKFTLIIFCCERTFHISSEKYSILSWCFYFSNFACIHYSMFCFKSPHQLCILLTLTISGTHLLVGDLSILLSVIESCKNGAISTLFKFNSLARQNQNSKLQNLWSGSGQFPARNRTGSKNIRIQERIRPDRISGRPLFPVFLVALAQYTI
jgi:hypothetical protein